jgi:hypothetical protein
VIVRSIPSPVFTQPSVSKNYLQQMTTDIAPFIFLFQVTVEITETIQALGIPNLYQPSLVQPQRTVLIPQQPQPQLAVVPSPSQVVQRTVFSQVRIIVSIVSISPQ